jgi:hypothetical protein
VARTTDADVELVAEVDSTISLTPFITIANELVTELCTDSGYNDTRLALIETWLAAHFYLIRDQAVASEKAGSVAVSYQYKIGLFLSQTKQGQTAMMLDTAGNLAALSKRMEDGEPAAIQFTWMGTDYDTEDVED